ncbi:viral A-type inclusion protein, partial [Enterococcus faecium]|nr:viral A-type inclusion protein [Enterococcus faecium]
MKEPDTNTNYEQGELEETSTNQDTAKESSSFYDIKEKASMNLSQLLEDLQAFEKAVREEDIPEIYRLYNGRLN